MNAEDMLKKIFQCMNELLEVKEFSKTIGVLTELGRTLANCERASFWFWNREEKQCWTLAATGNLKIKIPECSGIVGMAMLENKIQMCNDPYNEPAFNKQVDEQTGFTTKSVLCMPVTNSEGEVIGAFQAINKKNSDGTDAKFTQLDIEHLSLAAVYCEKTLESYLLQGEHHTHKTTGIKNKNAFYEYYNTKIARSVWKTKTSILMCGVDKLEEMRKEKGEKVVNAVLKKVTSQINEIVGFDDLLAMWDDNTYIIVLLGQDVAFAKNFAENIINNVTSQTIDADGTKVNVTMSVGIQEIDTLFTLDENIKFAADNLEDARRLGGSKVL